MRLQEKELIRKIEIPRPSAPLNSLPKRIPIKRDDSVMSFVLWGLGVLVLSVMISGMVATERKLAGVYAERLAGFSWLVLVEGDQLQQDEVGRILTQMDGVNEVAHFSSQAARQRMTRMDIFPAELGDFGEAYYPSSWQVFWEPGRHLRGDFFEDTLPDVMRIPGVMDVVFDAKAWDAIQDTQTEWLGVRSLLSLSLLLGALLGVVFLGHAIFFSTLIKSSWQKLSGVMAYSFGVWALGLFLISRLIGPLPLFVLWGGLILGVAHVLMKLRKTG